MLQNRNRFLFFTLLFALACAICLAALWLHPQNGTGNLPQGQSAAPPDKPYQSAENFGIQTVHSSVDFNGNGTDDYTDFLLGARKDAQNKPKYDSAYCLGGYPSNDRGVCTDVVWRAFQSAGYCLKDMVDQDIGAHTKDYPAVAGKPDPNIDFRRVSNLKVYFERHAVPLSTDPKQIAEWQPGDIVTFGSHHIGILSDRRNGAGIPWLIHNAGQPEREEDVLAFCGEISGHFRFDASRLSQDELIPWSVKESE
ncbi:MAG: DUF1287 domain-containing protein [Oscillospiraceae bacterium]|jgi:uncharacterized protein YijF (DUF1287 family)|nr:DUF1287 domain-containing protein [Oscillospiraceae bacterium]